MDVWDITAKDWIDLAKVILGAGLGTAFVQVWTYAHNRSRQGKLLALRLATQLEAYVAETCSLLYDISNYQSSRGAAGDMHSKFPELGDLPEDPEGWRSLSFQVADNVFRFRGRLLGMQRSIDGLSDIIGDEAQSDYVDRAVELAKDAGMIAASVRQYYDLPQPENELLEELDRVQSGIKRIRNWNFA